VESRVIARVQLGADDVHVWRARLDVSPAALRRLSTTLAPDEVERARQFCFVRDRNLFVAARAILRRVLSSYMRMAPHALLLRSTANGKPYLAHDKCEVHFNVSHSGAWVLYAVARREIGVDIERIDARLATAEVAMRVFTSRELAEWYALPVSSRAHAFFDCWTRKEASVKGRAEGLSLPLNELEVWSADEESRVVSCGGRAWLLRSLKAAAGYSAAVAVEGGCMNVKFLDFCLSNDASTIDGIAPEFLPAAIPG
jgi:4'-phosphopantetheinyl transferase